MAFWSDKKVLPLESIDTKDEGLANGEDKKLSLAEATQIRRLLTRIQYTLLSEDVRRRLEATEHSSVNDFCRITLILYSLTVLDENAPGTYFGQQIGNRFRSILTELACQSYNDVLDVTAADRNSPLPLDFQLWSMFLAISGVMKTESDTRSLATTIIR